MSLFDKIFNIVKFFYLYGNKYSVIEVIGDMNDLDFGKKRIVFLVKTKKLVMSNFPVTLKKYQIYMSVSKIDDFLKVIKENDISDIQLLDCKTKLSKKLFDHWDYPSIKIISIVSF